MPLHLVWRAARPRSLTLPRLFHNQLRRVLGIHLRVHGEPERRDVIYAANHMTWADIPIIGSVVRGRFVAMAEIAGMGAIAWFARQQRTILVNREHRQESMQQIDEIGRALLDGDRLIMFPESMTTERPRRLPFKSTLFAPLYTPELAHVRVQPVSVAFTRLNSMPMTHADHVRACWIGEVPLGENIAEMLTMGHIRADITFHEPLSPGDFADRKQLAIAIRDAIDRGYRYSMRHYIAPARSAKARHPSKTRATEKAT